MDPLIRSARMASSRTRLSKSAIGNAAESEASPGSVARCAEETLRAQIEKQVRAELVTQMRDLYESERARAHAAGLAAAVAEAQGAAAQELARIREQLQSRTERALSVMQQAHQASLSELKASVGEVAFAAICRLVGEKAMTREFVLGLVEQTSAQLRVDAVATARLHPRDIETLRDLLDGMELKIRSLGLQLIPDESLKLGGCVIEAASGHYDGGLENQLRRLHAVLNASSTDNGASAPVASLER